MNEKIYTKICKEKPAILPFLTELKTSVGAESSIAVYMVW